MVLLHGFPDIPATWDEVMSALPPGLRIVRPYLRGYGGSRVRPASWEEAGGAQVAALATDVLDLLDALGLGQALLVGHDWGARAEYAVAVLATERVTGLVAMATAYAPMRHLNAAERFTEAERASVPILAIRRHRRPDVRAAPGRVHPPLLGRMVTGVLSCRRSDAGHRPSGRERAVH